MTARIAVLLNDLGEGLERAPSRPGNNHLGVKMTKRPRIKMLPPRIPVLDTRIAPPVKVADRFYTSPEWIELRDQVRREAGGRCQWPGCAERGRYVDHRIEIKDGGARLDRQNCWLLCASHHLRKGAAERAKRAAR